MFSAQKGFLQNHIVAIMKLLSLLLLLIPFSFFAQKASAQEVAYDPYPGFDDRASNFFDFIFREQGDVLYSEEYTYDEQGLKLRSPIFDFFITSEDNTYSLGTIIDNSIGKGLVLQNNTSKRIEVLDFDDVEAIKTNGPLTAINDTFYFTTQQVDGSTKLFYIASKRPTVTEIKTTTNESFNRISKIIRFDRSFALMHDVYKYSFIRKAKANAEQTNDAYFDKSTFRSAGVLDGTVSPRRHVGIYVVNSQKGTFNKILGDTLELVSNAVSEYDGYIYFTATKPFSGRFTSYKYSIKNDALSLLPSRYRNHIVRQIDDRLVLEYGDTLEVYDGTKSIETLIPNEEVSEYTIAAKQGKHYILSKGQKHYRYNIFDKSFDLLSNTQHILSISRVNFYSWGLVFNGSVEGRNKNAKYFYRYSGGQLDSITSYMSYDQGSITTVKSNDKGLFFCSNETLNSYGITQSTDGGSTFSRIPESTIYKEQHVLHALSNSVLLTSGDENKQSVYPYSTSSSLGDLERGRVLSVVNDTLYYQSPTSSLMMWDGKSGETKKIIDIVGSIRGFVKTHSGIFVTLLYGRSPMQFIEGDDTVSILKHKFHHRLLGGANGKVLVSVSTSPDKSSTDELWLCNGNDEENELVFQRGISVNKFSAIAPIEKYKYKNIIPATWQNSSGSNDLCLINLLTGEIEKHGTVSNFPSTLGMVGPKLILTANNDGYGNEIYSFDLESGQFKLLADIFKGPLSSNPQTGFKGIRYDSTYAGKDRFVFFTAYDIENGYAIWKTDGTEAGTWLYSTLDIGNYERPENLLVSGDYLYFTGTKEFKGNHVLFKIKLDFDALGVLQPSAPEETAALHLFPNPANSVISIREFDPASGNMVKVYSQSGKVVLQSKAFDQSIDISSLQPGLYILEVIQNNFPTRSTFVKQ